MYISKKVFTYFLLPFSVLVMLILTLCTNSADAYDPPIGIPEPPFGIDEKPPSQPAGWPGSQVTGYYYINNTDTNATDTNNTYGYPDKPRVTVPDWNDVDYPAGSYVEIHGGPYTNENGTQSLFEVSGTASNPVWIRGSSSDSKPLIQDHWIITGEYVILENLKFDTNYQTLVLRSYHLGSHNYIRHAAIRSCEFSGPGTDAGSNAVINIYGSSTHNANNIVVYNNEIHDFGNKSRSHPQNDYMGVQVEIYSDHIWILENTIYNNGGDGIKMGKEVCSVEERPEYIYIGRNTIHDDRENAIDVKQADHIIISQNTCYGYSKSTSSSGEVVVIHYNPDNIWILYNKIHTGNFGLLTTGSTNTWFIGNVIYNIHHPSGEPWTWDTSYGSGVAIHFRGNSTTGGAVNNTLYDYDVGMQLTQAAAGYDVQNNIFSGRVEPLGMDIRAATTSIATASTLEHNLFYYNGGDARIYWGVGPFNLNEFKTATNKCLTCPAEANPQFLNPSSNNFSINETSPAKDTGTGLVNSAYITFSTRYGIDITKDIDGLLRPQGLAWDIGAYEFDSPPAKPKGLQIRP